MRERFLRTAALNRVLRLFAITCVFAGLESWRSVWSFVAFAGAALLVAVDLTLEERKRRTKH